MMSLKNPIIVFTILILSFSMFSQSSNYKEGKVYAKVKREYVNWFEEDKGEVSSLLDEYSVIHFKCMLSYFGEKYPNLQSESYRELCSIYELEFSTDISVLRQINDLKSSGLFEVVEPAYVFNVLLDYQPNDPLADSTLEISSGMPQLLLHDFYKAWGVEKGDTNVVIGVVDTGINFDQEDLKGNLKYNYDDPIDGVNNDGDILDGDTLLDDAELIDNFRGWDLGDDDNDPTIGSGAPHGSEMTSIISATPNNDTGMVGVAFNCKYLPIKAAPDESPNSIAYGYVGMIYAAEQGASVVNCSWGGNVELPVIFETLTNAITLDYDVLVVSAAGNESNENVYYPASFDHVISVTGLDYDSSKANSSNYNYYVDLIAAGFTRVATGEQVSSYRIENGTSGAAAVVSGLGGLVRSHFPEMSALQVKKQLEVTSDYIDTMASILPYAGKVGKRINPYNALTDTLSPGLEPFDFVINDDDQLIANSGEVVVMNHSVVNLLNMSSNVSYKISAVSDNFKVLDSVGVLPDLSTWDTIITVGAVELEFFETTETEIECVGRIDYEDELGYRDHKYFFFEMFPSDVTLVDESVLESSYNVFPNPFSDEIFVRTNSEHSVLVKLLDSNGLERSISFTQKGDLVEISPDEKLEQGVYFIQATSELGVVTLKTVKLTR